MRSFSKKLAFVLAAAMVVTTFAPAASAEAAKEMAINKSSKTLYVTDGTGMNDAAQVGGGKGNVSSYDFSVKNKPADWKSTLSFKWTSNNDDVATVSNGGLVTAVSAGKATITCKVTDKATKETVATLKTKVTVKKNAAEVEITNADKYDGTVVEVNGVVDLNRAMYDVDGTKTTKRGTVVTDYTKWVAEPAAGVVIDDTKGTFTFTEEAEAGEYKLYCYTYQSSKYTDATATSDAVVVEFQKADKFVVDQTASNGFNLVFDKAADLKITDVTVNKIIAVGDSTSKIPVVVSNVAMSEDKKTASVSVFANFENGATYEIAVTGYEETATFVAAIGAPVSMSISSKSDLQGGVAVYVGGTGAELTATLYDADGNDVTNTATGWVEYTAADVATSAYFVDNGYVIINEAGVQATVKAVYHTGEYDDYANEKNLTATGYFVGVTVAPNSIVSVDIKTEFWGSNLTKLPVNIGSMGDIALKVTIKTTDKDDDGKQVYANGAPILFLDENGSTYVRYRSTNPDVLGVDGDNIKLFTQGTSAILVDLVTLNADGSETPVTIAATYLTVVEGAKVSNISVGDGASVAVGTVDGYDQGEISFGVVDQYGFNWGAANWLETVEDNGEKVAAAFAKVAFADGTVIAENTKKGVWINVKREATGWTDKAVVDGSDMLAAMVAAGYLTIDNGNWIVNGKSVTTITKRVVATTAAISPNQETNSFTFNVTLKKAVGTVTKSVEASGTVSGNVARYNNGNDKVDTESAKSASFQVYTKQGGVKTGQLDLAGAKPDTASGSAIGTLYYTVTRNNVDITDTGAVKLNDAGNAVVLNYSGYVWDDEAQSETDEIIYTSWSAKNNKQMDLGAGNYVFTVYEVKENPTTHNLYFAYVGATSTTVTFDAGNYTYAKRLAESVKADFNDADLRACFKILGTDGKETTNTNYTVEKTVAGNYVHVKSITFTEDLFGGKSVTYKVNIGVSLKK